MTDDSESRYMVVSCDGHVGLPPEAYRDYLEQSWLGEFDSWLQSFKNPYEELFQAGDSDLNWDAGKRQAVLEGQGIVAEVLFPNTVPPFFTGTSFFVQAPDSPREYERQWAGLKAHNRWLADYCSDAPDRSIGIAQIMLNNVDDAMSEVRWVAEQSGLKGGILMPGVSPGSVIEPLWSRTYEPLWTLCEELDVVINHHGGQAMPEYGPDPVAQMLMVTEARGWSQRTLFHLIWAGVFERYPALKLVLTEQRAGWVPAALRFNDAYYERMTLPEAHEMKYLPKEAVLDGMSGPPSKYYEQNVFLGASFIHRSEVALRNEIGVKKIMWGADFPHEEGTYPNSKLALRASFSGVPQDEVALMLGGNAASIYKLDSSLLQVIADQVGPTVAEVARPLGDDSPGAAVCTVFDDRMYLEYK